MVLKYWIVDPHCHFGAKQTLLVLDSFETQGGVDVFTWAVNSKLVFTLFV